MIPDILTETDRAEVEHRARLMAYSPSSLVDYAEVRAREVSR